MLVDLPLRAVIPELQVLGPMRPRYGEILTDEARQFIARLAAEFEPRRQELLALRHQRQRDLDDGVMPDFLEHTKHIRQGDWKVAPPAPDLVRRRVEITGPVERKMIINAMNSGADVFMADFEDSNSPTWDNVIRGQINLRDAVTGSISFTNPEGKEYRLAEKTAVLMVRPRGWHLVDKHILFQGQPVSASLLDFGLFYFHNARDLVAKGSGPYFYLPKMESHLEARLWNDVFVWAQEQLEQPRGTIRATVLIETILAAFEMDEILYELKDHSAGLNCGRWDYIFSIIKKFRNHRKFLLPDRRLVTMTTPFMRAYALLTIQTCHRRGAHAMGGMAAQIPIKDDSVANRAALEAVRADKQREVADGHDGSWVAHPGLVPIAMESFGSLASGNQLDRQRSDVKVSAADLLDIPSHPHISIEGINTNINVGIRYLESWLRGSGCVPINNLMEDAATAEISRAQLWQWAHHHAVLVEDLQVNAEVIEAMIEQELERLRLQLGEQTYGASKFDLAGKLFVQMVQSRQCPEFLTTRAYTLI